MAISPISNSAGDPRPVFSPEGPGWTHASGAVWWKTAGPGDADLFFRIGAEHPRHVTIGNLLVFDGIKNLYAEFSGCAPQPPVSET